MRFYIFSAMSLIAATYGLARFGYGLFLPRFTETFEIGAAASGSIQAGNFLAFCLAASLAIRIDAHPRRVIICAGATAAIGAAGVAAAPNVGVFAASVVLAGAGAGFATPGLVTLTARNVIEARRESAQTIVNAGTGAGIVVAGILMFLTMSQWRLGWAAMALLIALVTLSTLISDRPDEKAPPRRSALKLRREILRPLAWPILAALLAGASSAAIFTFGREIMEEARPDQEAYSILAWMTLGAFGVLGAAAGRMAQRWTPEFAWNLTVVIMALSAVLLAGFPGITLPAFTSVALFGASYTAICGILIIWSSRIIPDRASVGTAVLFIALAIGQAAGAVLLGILMESTTTLLTFLTAGALGVAAVIPAVRLSATKSDPETVANTGKHR
ncbi:MFS transporter [Nesterenkonia sandarakina]|uniref:Putative MFS family arabinose efflux permease n=1 Tax=Nesterenkonia sandarakina TaxID=272918 RepID=A0A7Z0E6F8_9MICC|nr:MFS transporter [Nesterenkonia sandarakina]NYJ15759.1 putative MFS family arabinose efflux permease [Nesterenkonia sandarakina]